MTTIGARLRRARRAGELPLTSLEQETAAREDAIDQRSDSIAFLVDAEKQERALRGEAMETDRVRWDRPPYGDALKEDAPLDDEGKPVAIEPLPTVQVRLGIGTILHLYQQGFDTCGPAIVWKVEPGQIVCATVLAGKVGQGITGILHLPKPSTLTIMARGGLTWHFIEECPWGR